MGPVVYIGIPPRKLAELLAALYGVAMGVYGGMAWSGGQTLFGWISTDYSDGGTLALLFMAAAAIHAFGVRINGRWRWSPIMRFVGMTIHTALIAFLAWKAVEIRWSSASVTYPFVLVLFLVGWVGTIKDAVRALNGERQDWNL